LLNNLLQLQHVQLLVKILFCDEVAQQNCVVNNPKCDSVKNSVFQKFLASLIIGKN